MRNAWGTSDNTPTTSLKTVARIKKPDSIAIKDSTKFSHQIRNDILRDEFSYTDAEIADFNIAHPSDWVIEDTEFPNKWATDIQVKSWRVEADGLIPIVLEEPWVRAVQGFQEQRAAFEALKVGMFITNAEIKKNLTEDFENILASYGNKRIYALTNLMVTISGSPSSRGEIYKALRYLSNESGYKNNPFLMIALASIPTYKSDTPSLSSADVNQGTIANAVNIAYNNLYNNPAKSALVKISREEAAQINEWASKLYDNIKANDQATDRRWVARLLEMSEAQRRSLKEGDTFSIGQPDVNAMRGLFPSEKRLQNEDRKFEKKKQEWAENDQIGKDQSVDIKDDGRQPELFQKPTDKYPTGSKFVAANNAAHEVEVGPSKFKSIYSNDNVNAVGAPVALFLEYGKWYTANERMNIITAYLIKRRKLEARVRLDNLHVVPPPPKVIEQYLKDFQRDGRITFDPLQKTRIFGILSELNRLLEESYAFYGKK